MFYNVSLLFKNYYFISVLGVIFELLCMYRPVNRRAILDLMLAKEMFILYIISHHILAFTHKCAPVIVKY